MGVLYAYTEGETYVLRGGLGKSLLAHGLLEHLELLLGHGGRCKRTKKRARAKKGVGTERGGERHGRQDSVKSCTNCECVSVCVCVPQLWTGVMKTSRFFCLTRAKTKPEVSKSTRFTPDTCKHDRLSLRHIRRTTGTLSSTQSAQRNAELTAGRDREAPGELERKWETGRRIKWVWWKIISQHKGTGASSYTSLRMHAKKTACSPTMFD